MITAKVKVHYKGSPADGQVKVDFMPDYNDGRNKEWSKYTPNLTLSLTVLESVAEKFELGAAYTLQFVKEEEANVSNAAA